MTYRRDSDIPYPYGAIESKENPYPYPPRTDEAISWKPFDSQAFSQSLKSRSKDFFNLAKKPKKVAWIVSNCNTHSQREDFVRELRKHIQVDIFGGCGPTKCDKGHSYKSDNCSKVVDEEYKFYLSFENSFCNGYVTEKFFRRISHSVVPIVLGSGNYSVLAPPHSYINVMDFASPADLATYLLHLDQHDEEYLSYFWWRDIYDARWGFRFENKAFCRLCAMLNNPEEPVKSYKSLQDWWVKDGHCIKKGSFPWSQPEQPFIMTSIQEFADRLFGTSSVIWLHTYTRYQKLLKETDAFKYTIIVFDMTNIIRSPILYHRTIFFLRWLKDTWAFIGILSRGKEVFVLGRGTFNITSCIRNGKDVGRGVIIAWRCTTPSWSRSLSSILTLISSVFTQSRINSCSEGHIISPIPLKTVGSWSGCKSQIVVWISPSWSTVSSNTNPINQQNEK